MYRLNYFCIDCAYFLLKGDMMMHLLLLYIVWSTTCEDGHVHMHPGVTSLPIETGEGHIHHMNGNTTFEDGHIHQYATYTSIPIPMPGGFHTHYVEIRTTKDDGHTHVIKGFTEPSLS